MLQKQLGNGHYYVYSNKNVHFQLGITKIMLQAIELHENDNTLQGKGCKMFWENTFQIHKSIKQTCTECLISLLNHLAAPM